jgi:hypothetical protein
LKKLLLPLCLLVALCGNSQIVINEVASASDTGFVDEDGDYEDWIELYNTSSTATNLENYSISRIENFKTNSWTFPKITIPANGYLTVFCSEKNRKDYFHHWEVPVYAAGVWKYNVGGFSLDSTWTATTYNDGAWPTGTGGIGYGDNDDATAILPCTTLYMRQNFYVADTSRIIQAE